MAVAEAKPGQAHGGQDAARFHFHRGRLASRRVGAAATAWPFVDQMNPAADTRAMSTTEVDLGAIDVGQQIKVMWQGKPVFVRHRTAAEIAAARRDDFANLKDPQTDAERIAPGRRPARQAGMADPAGQLHASGLRADFRRRLAIRRLVLPVPRLRLRYLGPHSPRAGAEESAASPPTSSSTTPPSASAEPAGAPIERTFHLRAQIGLHPLARQALADHAAGA